MTATPEQAVDDILDVFKAAWDTTGFTAVYDEEGVAGKIPATQDPWSRVSVRHATGEQASLSGGTGTKRYRSTGFVMMQIFTPIGESLVQARQLAQLLKVAYQGITTPRQVWFRRARLNEVGSDGDWYQINVIADFTYDEIS